LLDPGGRTCVSSPPLSRDLRAPSFLRTTRRTASMEIRVTSVFAQVGESPFFTVTRAAVRRAGARRDAGARDIRARRPPCSPDFRHLACRRYGTRRSRRTWRSTRASHVGERTRLAGGARSWTGGAILDTHVWRDRSTSRGQPPRRPLLLDPGGRTCVSSPPLSSPPLSSPPVCVSSPSPSPSPPGSRMDGSLTGGQTGMSSAPGLLRIRAVE